MPTTYSRISNYWNANPCNGGYNGFPFINLPKSRVLEIGCGTGNDALKFIGTGARYTGIDLTPKAVKLTKQKIGKKGKVFRMNAEKLDFPDNYFDIVYSFGVIHHALNPEKIVNEIYRVLKKNGWIYIMLYNKYSFRYLIEINILRRILWLFNHPKYAQIKQFIPYPTKEEWLSINTDNIGCPLSRVYTDEESRHLFRKFDIHSSQTTNWGWYRILFGAKC